MRCLHRASSQKSANRHWWIKQSVSQFRPYHSPQSCDEYPFATTREEGPPDQHGHGASIMLVPGSEQSIQNGEVGGFYSASQIADHTTNLRERAFSVVVVPTNPSYYTCKN